MPIKRAEMFREIASLENAHDIFAFMMGTISYSDRIILQRGSGVLDWYDLMVDSDAWLSGLLDTRIGAVAGLPWEIIPTSEDEKDIKLAEFVEWAFDKIGKFYQDRKDLLSACRAGFAVSEIVYAEKKWDGSMRLVPDRLMSRRPERFSFDKDYKLRLKVKGNLIKGVETEPMKWVVNQFDPRYEDPYGTSLLRACYWPWWFKHNAMSWWLKAAERGAVVTPVGYYPEHYNETEISAFSAALKRFMGDQWLAAKEGTHVEFPAIKIDPEFASKLREATNDEMVYRVLGGIQSTSGGEGGSLAKAAVHDRRFQERIESDSIGLQDTINEQILKPMVLLNFPEPDDFPFFKIKYELPPDTAEIGKRLETAAKLQIPVSVADAAELLMLPLAAEGEDTIKIAQAPSPFGGAPAGADGKPPGESPPGGEPPDDNAGSEAGTEPDPNEELDAMDPDIRKAFRSFQLRAERQTERLNRFMDGAVSFGRSAAADIRRQITEFMGSAATYEELIAKVGTFDLNVDKLAESLYWIKMWGFLNGYVDLTGQPKAVDARRGNVKPVRKRFQDFVDYGIRRIFASDWIPVDPEMAILLFEKRMVWTRKDFDTLDALEKRESITAAGMTRGTIIQNLRPALLTGLRQGITLDQFKDQAGNIFLSDAHAENVFRTNMVSAYNSGHAEAMFDPQIRDAITGFEFVAIVDARTTDICRERAGQKYPKEALMEGNVPPLHYQCRSTIVEIFADETPPTWSKTPTVPAAGDFGAWKTIVMNPSIGPIIPQIPVQPSLPKPKAKKPSKDDPFKQLRTTKSGNQEIWPEDTPLIRNVQYDRSRNSGSKWPPKNNRQVEAYQPTGKAPIFETVKESNVPSGVTSAGRKALPEFNQQMQDDMLEGLARTFDTGKEWGATYYRDGTPYYRGLVRGNSGRIAIDRPEQNSLMWHSHPFGNVKSDGRIMGGSFSGADVGNCVTPAWRAGQNVPGSTQIELAIDNRYVYIFRRDPQSIKVEAAAIAAELDSFVLTDVSITHEETFELYHQLIEKVVAQHPGFKYTRILRTDLGL